jgi:hypothetical protein
MNVAEARELGWEVRRGDYVGTCDNRLDRWYLDWVGRLRDRTGAGFRTQGEALEALEAWLATLAPEDLAP